MSDQPRWPRGTPSGPGGKGPGGGRFRQDGPDAEGWIQRLMDKIEPAIRYYHGTVAEDLEEVLPANLHGGGVVFFGATDRDYAYATENEDDAWHYAEAAHSAGPPGSLPRIYEVEPIDPEDVEEDPFYDERGRPRSVFEGDRRSRKGWRVIREMPWPEAWGDPEDWR